MRFVRVIILLILNWMKRFFWKIWSNVNSKCWIIERKIFHVITPVSCWQHWENCMGFRLCWKSYHQKNSIRSYRKFQKCSFAAAINTCANFLKNWNTVFWAVWIRMLIRQSFPNSNIYSAILISMWLCDASMVQLPNLMLWFVTVTVGITIFYSNMIRW